jgi:hypothetical protein
MTETGDASSLAISRGLLAMTVGLVVFFAVTVSCHLAAINLWPDYAAAFQRGISLCPC